MFPVNKALEEAVARVGDKWTLLLVSALLDGPRRFNDLVDDLGGIAPNVLSQRLRQLEQHGILVATPYSTRPPRFVYQLTGSGLELAGVLRLLAQWGAGQGPSASGGGEPLRHPPCGTPMEARWYCPTCGAVVDDDTASDDVVRFL
ncbi:MAG TPA: helix-turn-helix domain-containing protein [Acidimicrobiales bacterium]